jgi:protein-tyrosine phosphatase
VIDLHSHVLPGVDDGARTLAESLEIARAAAAEGVETLVATPHVREDYPTDPATVERLVAEVQAALRDEGVPLALLGGGEVAFDFLPQVADADLVRFGLGGSRVILLEAPYHSWPINLAEIVFRLRARRFVPVLAHPERNGEVQERPERLRPHVENGLLVQVTAASLEGRLGPSSRQTALALVERGLAHLVASDAHTPDVRAFGMRKGLDALRDAALARWLSQDVPAALLAGDELPERPLRRRRFGRVRR